MTRLLEQSSLSIHLIGAVYGAVPDGPSQRSIVVLQNEAAITRSRSAGLRRVIWLPDGTNATQVEQQQFIEALHKDADAQFGADLMVGDLEALKGAVHAALGALEKPVPAVASSENSARGERLGYVICDEQDRKATIPLRKFIRSQGFDVQIPVFEGDAETVRRNNEDLLTRCDAVIVFYGVGDPSWKRSIDSDLRKMDGVRRGKLSQCTYTYLAEKETATKRDMIEMDEPRVINWLEGFSEGAIQPFRAALKGQ